MKSRRRGVFAPKILIPLLAAGAVGIGAVGVMSLLARRGEAAFSMIPADACVAVSFDNTPSASQVPLFNEIKAAMQDSGLNSWIDNFLESMDPRTGSFKKLRSHIRGSFAVGMWGDLSKKPNVMVAIALEDPSGAEQIISSLAAPGAVVGDGKFPLQKKEDNGFRYYEVPEGKMVLTFYGDYAIFATDTATAQKAISVGKGQAPNIYEQPAFKQARQSLPDDASLMVFVSGEAIAKADPNTQKVYEALGVHPQGWMACGMTLRREGILFDSYEPATSQGVFREALLKMKPLTYESLDKFPKGAIGVFGLSSPGTYVELLQKAFSSVPDVGPEMKKGIAEMEKEIGTSFEGQWIPALRGEVYAAMYPPAPGQKEPGFILSIDNRNGGSATTFFKEIVAKVNSGKFDKNGETVRLKEMQDGEFMTYIPQEKNSKNTGLIGVTDNQVMLFSNRGVFEQTKAKDGSLPDTEGLASYTQGDPAQFRLQLDMYKLLDMLESMGESPKDINLRQILSSRDLTVTGYCDGKVSTAHVLIPLNIPELIRVIGKEAKKGGGPALGAAPPVPAPPKGITTGT